MAISFIDFVYDDAGDAVVGATVELFDRNTTTPVRATTTTDSAGKFSISHATEGRFDVRITNGSSVRFLKYDVSYQSEAAELALLNLRNPGETFKYVVTPGAIAAERILNLPVLTQTAAVYVTPAIEDLDLDGNNIDNGGVIYLKEQAEADADVAGSGQIWVNTATPNELYFTDDAGTDFQLGAGSITEATAADMEDRGTTNANRYASPEVVHFHQGVAKVASMFEQQGSHGLTTNYNLDSVLDGGSAGLSIFAITTNFSSANYEIAQSGNDTLYLSMVAQSAATLQMRCRNDSGTATDITQGYIILHGDQ